MKTSSPINPMSFFWPWPSAPAVEQPILPGWSFGSVTINQQNSSAPSTELAIVSSNSYGRQLGKLLDAVAELVTRQDGAKQPKVFVELLALRDSIERTKVEAAKDRLKQLKHDLATLKDVQDDEYAAILAGLRELLSR